MRLATILALALLACATMARACPTNTITMDDVGYPSYGPTATLSHAQEEYFIPWTAGTPCNDGCYDLPHGWLESHGYNTLYGNPGTTVTVEDEYWIDGPATGPMVFEVVIQIKAEICAGGLAGVSLWMPSSPPQGLDFSLSEPVETEGAVTLTAAPGERFLVGASASAIGGRFDGESDVQAVIRFRGVPAGYEVRSCQGYALTTPARTSSWGGVKALYR